MQQMTKGECSDVINQLTTHDKIKMMHGIMETQRLQQLENKTIKEELKVINKFFDGVEEKQSEKSAKVSEKLKGK
jgi:UbiD family decarboxylase